MFNNEISTRGMFKPVRMAIALIAAIVVFGGSLTEASAKLRHHHRHKHHHHHSHKHHHHHKHHGHRHHSHRAGSDWMNANASLPASTGGGGFSGMASYYGSESGNRTASGARFNPGGLTAAHRSLPFGTKLRVSHGGRSVVVTVNDRGPFIRGRVLDLSRGAASAIGLTSRGVGRIVAERI